MKRPITSRTLLLCTLCALSGCSTYRAHIAPEYQEWEQTPLPAASGLAYKVFLIGDTGSPSLETQEPTFKLLQGQLEAAGESSAVVFLGDNI
jgi:hypothetical protein